MNRKEPEPTHPHATTDQPSAGTVRGEIAEAEKAAYDQARREQEEGSQCEDAPPSDDS